MNELKDIHKNGLTLSAENIIVPALNKSLAQAIKDRDIQVPSAVEEEIGEIKATHAFIKDVVVNVTEGDTASGTATFSEGVLTLNLVTVKGADGAPGMNGKSAYEVAVTNGFEGTEAEWLESLKTKGLDEDAIDTTALSDSDAKVPSSKLILSLMDNDGNLSTEEKAKLSSLLIDDDAFYICDASGNVAFKIAKDGEVSYYGMVTEDTVNTAINSAVSKLGDNFETKNNFPADINLVITHGQSNSLNGTYSDLGFANSLIFSNKKLALLTNIDGKTDDEVAEYLGSGLTNFSEYSGSLFSIGGGIAEFIKSVKEENKVTDYNSLGYQLMGISTGQVKPIADLTNPADIYYKRILTVVRFAKNYAGALGKSFAVPYLTYIQGEADISMEKKKFYDYLWVFFSNVNHDIKAITGQVDDVVFMTYQQGWGIQGGDKTSIPNGSAFAHVQLAIDEGDGTGYTIETAPSEYLQNGVSLIDRKGIHFSSPFYFLNPHEDGTSSVFAHLDWDLGCFNIFGAYQGLQAKRCLVDNNPISVLRPIDHQIIDNGDGKFTILVEFNVPVEPLQFKPYDSIYGNAKSSTRDENGFEPNYGFQLTETEWSTTFKDIIQSVSIVRRKYVKIITTVDPTNLYLTYAQKFWYSGGNLCDSQGNNNNIKIGNNIFALDNWCPTFDYLLN